MKICHICSGPLQLFEDFPSFVQVTSDCRPWKAGGQLAHCGACGIIQKPVTEDWLKEARNIYSEYNVYCQANGKEQSSFDQITGSSQARSKRIVQWLSGHYSLTEQGKLLDIGCGNGSFLEAFGTKFPNWKMQGLELDDRNKSVVEKIPGVTALHAGPIKELKDKFDLIVLIHSLEHIPNPIEYLKLIRPHLAPNGLVFIQVPDLKMSPFDLLIADHCTHFDFPSLKKMVSLAGFEMVAHEGDFVPKELSFLARPLQNDFIKDDTLKMLSQKSAEMHLGWLKASLNQGQRIEGQVGVFGTSIAGTWLAASLKDKVSFFVDEDSGRVGRKHFDRIIYGPENAPHDVSILVPLRADIANSIISRLKKFDIKLVPPPQVGQV